MRAKRNSNLKTADGIQSSLNRGWLKTRLPFSSLSSFNSGYITRARSPRRDEGLVQTDTRRLTLRVKISAIRFLLIQLLGLYEAGVFWLGLHNNLIQGYSHWGKQHDTASDAHVRSDKYLSYDPDPMTKDWASIVTIAWGRRIRSL